MNSINSKQIGIPVTVKTELDKAKLTEYESYGSVISRALKVLRESQGF